MKKSSLTIQEHWILDGDFTPESGQQALKKVIFSGKLPTALIYANDLMALDALTEMQNAKVKVPEELTLIGFDGIGITAFTNPPLTTMRQPLFDMGYTAAEILFSKIKDPEQPPEYRIFPVELIERKSVSDNK